MSDDQTVSGAAFQGGNTATEENDASFDAVGGNVALINTNAAVGGAMLDAKQQENADGKGPADTDVNKDSDPNSQQSALAQSGKDAEAITSDSSGGDSGGDSGGGDSGGGDSGGGDSGGGGDDGGD